MTKQQKAAMQQALAFTMREFATVRDFKAARAMVRDALEAALAEPEPEPEPVAERNREWQDGFLEGRLRERQYWLAGCCMNTTPPARRQLTDAEIASLKAERDAMDQLRRASGDRADGYKLLFDLSDAACKKAEAERDALRATLSCVADIAHNGGWVESDWLTLFVAIRRLTLPHFDLSGMTDQIKTKVQAAIDAAREAK